MRSRFDGLGGIRVLARAAGEQGTQGILDGGRREAAMQVVLCEVRVQVLAEMEPPEIGKPAARQEEAAGSVGGRDGGKQGRVRVLEIRRARQDKQLQGCSGRGA